MGMEIIVSVFWVYFTSTFKIMQPGYRFINFTLAASTSLASIRMPPTIPPLLVFTLKMYLFNLLAPNEIDVELRITKNALRIMACTPVLSLFENGFDS